MMGLLGVKLQFCPNLRLKIELINTDEQSVKNDKFVLSQNQVINTKDFKRLHIYNNDNIYREGFSFEDILTDF